MSASYERVFQRCAECGAQCGPTAQRCWMCDAPLSRETTPPKASGQTGPLWNSDRQSARSGGPMGGTARLLLIAALAVIGVGLALRGIGLAILYLLVVIPALIAMSLTAARQHPEQSTEAASLAEQLAILFGKFLMTVAILVLVLVGIVIAAGTFCFVLLVQSKAIHF